MTNKDIFAHIKRLLSGAGLPDAGFEAGCILEDAMGLPPAELAVRGGEQAEDGRRTDKALEIARRRVCGEPLQYLLGKWEFYGFPVKVGEGVFIPRPETETLVDAVYGHFKSAGADSPRIVDLCGGTGCIAIALCRLLPGADVCAIENSAAALAFAAENIRLCDFKVKLIEADVLDARVAERFSRDGQAADCVVSNPPYLGGGDMESLQAEVSREPRAALDGGPDGLRFYRAISRLWKRALKPGGLIAFEIGAKQARAVSGILAGGGYSRISVVKDAAGLDRVVTGAAPFAGGRGTV